MTDRSFEIVGACKNEEQNALPKKVCFQKKMFEGKTSFICNYFGRDSSGLFVCKNGS